MDRTYGSGLILLAGVALLGTAVAIHAILLETVVWTGGARRRGQLSWSRGRLGAAHRVGAVLGGRRGEIALYTWAWSAC